MIIKKEIATSKFGFSLVELSIVLVVLGLLTGGVITGQSLIRAANLRYITTQSDELRVAVMTFKQKYFALPGDITNATAFWGAMSTGACPNASATGTQTCNGDGNGLIEWLWAGDNVEPFIFWQHLSNAGLMLGKYSGSWSGAYSPANSLSAKSFSAYWYTNYYGNVTIARTDHFSGSHGHDFMMFSSNGSGILTPSEMWNIDKKFDDGKPASGKIIGKESDGVPCHSVAASNATDLTNIAAYNLTNDSLGCTEIIFTNVW
jgi:prepilin-type N-terminal cleavage/methylation domain-containing protein